MKTGSKITALRTEASLSREELATKLNATAASLSEWEQNETLPPTDKLLSLCQLFGVSADWLLNDDAKRAEKPDASKKKKYFGTDGFRGEAGVELTSMHAYKVGRFLGWYFASPLSGCARSGYRPRIVVGKDTRRSSYMLEYSLVAGITASGADAYMLHVTTTPSVSYVTRIDDFDCGIMITASHNPYYDNGIKVINRYGEKLNDTTTALIESYLDGDMAALGIEGDDLPLAYRDRVGCIVDHVSGRNRYLGYLVSLAAHSYKNLKIGLDCANGASWMLAKALFGALGAQTYVVGAEPDGINVNLNCGSTHVENLCRFVRDNHLDVGFAFDGDADRCIAVDEKGNVVDGDGILYVLARRLKEKGTLTDNTVVATIMSNSGLLAAFEELGVKCEQTTVGDRFVYERMQEKDYALGGEQSGHIILKKYATTGDGLLTAIMLTEEICDRKSTLSKLVEPLFLYPQHIENVKVKDKAAALSDEAVLAECKQIEAALKGKGRVLLRKSGTEPLVRVMIEAETQDLCAAYATRLANKILERGHGVV